MAKRKANPKQTRMTFNPPARIKNNSGEQFQKYIKGAKKSIGEKAAEKLSAKSSNIVKSGNSALATTKKAGALATTKKAGALLKSNASKASVISKLEKAKKVKDVAGEFTPFVEVAKKAKSGRGKAAALVLAGVGGKMLYDSVKNSNKGTGVKSAYKKGESKLPKVDNTKPEKKNQSKTSNPKFVKEFVEGLQRPSSKKPKTKKPVTGSTVIGNTKFTIKDKNNFKAEPNLKKPTVKTPDNTSIEQKAKDVMSGKYGNGDARKKALGSDYDAVQAIVNKQLAGKNNKSSKPATKSAEKTPEAPMEKMEIKRPSSIAYTGPTELSVPKKEKKR